MKKPDEATFIINSLVPGEKEGRLTIHNLFGFMALCPTMVYHGRISLFFDRPGFRVDRIGDLQEGSDRSRRLKIEFSIPKPDKLKAGSRPITSGWLVVSPDDGWLLHEYGSVTENQTKKIYTGIGHVTYDKPGSAVPVRSQYRVYRGVFDSDPTVSDPSFAPILGEDFEFTSFQFAGSPESDFTLSAFGLPEFGQTVAQAATAQSRPWWILVLAVISAFAAFVLRRLSLKGRSSKVSPSA
jgi:hypothetical protein